MSLSNFERSKSPKPRATLHEVRRSSPASLGLSTSNFERSKGSGSDEPSEIRAISATSSMVPE